MTKRRYRRKRGDGCLMTLIGGLLGLPFAILVGLLKGVTGRTKKDGLVGIHPGMRFPPGLMTREQYNRKRRGKRRK